MSEVPATHALWRFRLIPVGALLVASLLLDSSARAQRASGPHEGRKPEAVALDRRKQKTAARTPPGALRRPGGWTVSAFTGGARTLGATLTLVQPGLDTRLSFGGVRFDGRSFEPPLYYALRGGYFFRQRPGVGVEAEFIHLKIYSDPSQQLRVSGTRRGVPLDAPLPLSAIVQRYSVSHGVNLLLLNLAARRAFSFGAAAGRPRLMLTARVGAGPTVPHTESTIEGEAQEQYEVGRPAVQASAGAEVRLVGGLHALGEYKFTRTRQRGSVARGEAESLLRTHHAVLGLSYHF